MTVVDGAMHAVMPADPIGPTSRIGRDGHLRLRFERRGARTVVTDTSWTLPLQVMAPVALDARAAVVSVLNPSGGLVGGDRLTIDVTVGPGAHAVITTPSATRVYRTAGDPAIQTITLRLARGAVLEWVPDHTIPFAGSAFRQSLEAQVAGDATLVLVDAFAAGRVARGETWCFAHLESALTVRDDAGLLLAERFVLDGRVGDWGGLGFAEGHPYFAAIAAIGDVSVDALAAATVGVERTALSADSQPGTPPKLSLAVGRLARRGAVVRVLATDAPGLDAALTGVWGAARRVALGLEPLGLRKS